MMDERPLRYWVEIGESRFEVREIRGHEALSSPFRLEAGFVADAALPPDPDDLLRREAHVVLERGGRTVRRIDGIITDASLGAAIRGAPDLAITIEPRLSLAGHRTDMRVLRDRSVPEIVEEVLSQIGVAPVRRLRGTYEKRPYCVQHRESDLDFVSRLLEDEGIFYFFLEGDILVLGDSPAAYEPIEGDPAIPYRAGSGMDQHEDAVVSLGRRAALTVGEVSLRDWDPEHPSLDMDVSAPGPTAAGPEFYDYPGEYQRPDDGARKARLMSEAFACAAAAYAGTSFCGRLAPGRTFKITGAPGGASPGAGAPDGEYVVTRLDHDYERAGSGFSNAFEALREGVTYRPPRATHVPTQVSPVTGFVTGPAGEDDIYTDAFGRVKVHFHWDRRLPPDGECSHWMPVLQDNTGHSSAVPRMGWEVLVHFMEGDPDRPVVLGRVYNAEDPFPVPLPARKTCTSLKSLCSPTRDGTNEIQLEDLAGQEYIWVHAERDQNVVVANDKDQRILVHETSKVGRDETIAIGTDHTAAVGQDALPSVGGNQTWATGADRRLVVATADTSNVLGDRALSIGGTHHHRAGSSDGTFARTLDEQIGGIVLESFQRSNSTESSDDMVRTVAGGVVEIADVGKAESATLGRTEAVAGSVISKAGERLKISSNRRRAVTVGGSLIARAVEEVVLTGGARFKTLSATATHTAAGQVSLKVQDTVVLLKDGLIKIYAKSTISMKVSGDNQQGAGESYQV